MIVFQQVVVTFTVTPLPSFLLSHVIFDTFSVFDTLQIDLVYVTCTEKVTSTWANLLLVLLIFIRKVPITIEILEAQG